MGSACAILGAMKAFAAILILLGVQAQAAAAQEAPAGGWSTFAPESRPKLTFETLKGYRLFFHPDNPVGERRSLNLAVPVDRRLVAAWAIVRPFSELGEYAEAWLRVEGEYDPQQGRVALAWDGTYRGRAFPDAPYRFEVHLKYADGEEQKWDVLVLKSRDEPILVRFADVDIRRHRLVFQAGRYVPQRIEASVSRGAGSVALLARVFLPTLPAPFDASGILVQGRRLEDAEGKAVDEAWTCLCQQPIPADSPARRVPKKVRCDWNLADAEPGVWDLRLALYHEQKPGFPRAACDEPVLDEDRVRVRLLP